MYLTSRSNRSVRVGDESGMMIVQVVIMSAILLAVLLAGFKTVQTSLQVSNTTASSAAFKDLVLAVQQNLASSKTCVARLGLPANLNIASIHPTNGLEVKVVAPAAGLPPIAQKEPPNPTSPVAAEFKITEVKLRNVKLLGWNNGASLPGWGGAGTQELAKMSVDLNIVAERRSGFLGGKSMSAQVPLLLGVVGVGGARQIRNCTTRSLYQVELGPTPMVPANIIRKSGLECIDRGGVPILEPVNKNFYICRLPAISLTGCDPTRNYAGRSLSNLPGWYCFNKTTYDPDTGAGYTDVY